MCLGFTAIYCVRHYEKYKETGRKINKQKQLESNPQGQASYSNKSIEKGRNKLMQASWKAKSKVAVQT